MIHVLSVPIIQNIIRSSKPTYKFWSRKVVSLVGQLCHLYVAVVFAPLAVMICYGEKGLFWGLRRVSIWILILNE
jgi:hypothetical protein